MKRNIILLICLILLPLQVMTLTAQERKMNMADYEKRKKEFVEKEAGLSKAEADKYFPLTNELTKKKFELHRKHREKVQRIKDNSNISEAEYRKLLDDDVDLKMKEAALEKEYAPRFEKVLTPEKLYRAQQAERQFIQKEVTNFRSNRGNGRNK
ncbi:MAG TPA: hypothetical protein PLH60_01925 [Proteiniphilum sp.]|nr:hypothetical protein [Proteiniphilum sp.]HPD87304.1 hypothetical protein [Proteiniphilum sp.]HPJ49787.1 hypothetical protein [Proteiniphilum sp.]HPR19301.1 hypothetical protein [Proteiniphilum sp.]